MTFRGRKRIALPVAAILAAACAQLNPAISPTESSSSAKFSWLEGCWESTSGTTREIWTQSYDGLLFGHSVTLRDGEVVFFEDLRIEDEGETGVYIASPGGSAPVRFELARYADGAATFENPGHDDPQRITYALADGGLAVVISLMDGSRERTFAFTPCTTPLP